MSRKYSGGVCKYFVDNCLNHGFSRISRISRIGKYVPQTNSLYYKCHRRLTVSYATEPHSYLWRAKNFTHRSGCQYLGKKWQHLQVVALEAEDTVLLSADVEGPTLNGKRGCRVR